ncbi:MAG: hypothetical protein N838_21615 [Thiohalocapsa sp. PB-PSB1]|jgi:hypothetical protein|nr:MAG: hypothetical protein N838_04385 [Thiohalocapsa sp. PB-PSB1]QQO55554.1 MAG: hypothetical protein N838_21615 [Thiohalocapsa sp. PB-PSB1]
MQSMLGLPAAVLLLLHVAALSIQHRVAVAESGDQTMPIAMPLSTPAPTPASAVIGFDLAALDEHGLIGPQDGKRAVDYEYCIPNHQQALDEVLAIDPSARVMAGSPGRIGCSEAQWLVLGNTHQPGFRDVLHQLARLAFVRRIEQAVFE